jgi:hypothetical protein
MYETAWVAKEVGLAFQGVAGSLSQSSTVFRPRIIGLNLVDKVEVCGDGARAIFSIFDVPPR